MPKKDDANNTNATTKARPFFAVLDIANIKLPPVSIIIC